MPIFNDIELVRQELKRNMPLNELIALVDHKFTIDTGTKCDGIERVNDELYKKRCDLLSHKIDSDGTRDSTPSFTICPPKELWYCFGCGASGDRFEYISQRFNVDHYESIVMCAEIQGFDLNPYYKDMSIEEQARLNLYLENDGARDLAHNTLLMDDNARNYLLQRGITDESIDRYQIGYAPPLNDGKTIFDNIANCKTLQLHRKNQFNDAIVFPINNIDGHMRYFQSRPFNPLPGQKYICADDTHPLFEDYKIFGLDIARRMVSKHNGKMICVEGAPDTIACTQQGICACGLLGTVFNENTYELFSKYHINEIILLLDGDLPGRTKSFKIAEKYLEMNTNIVLKIATIDEELDPEEYINKNGKDKLINIIDNAKYAIQYLIDLKWNEAKTPTDKMNFMQSIKIYMDAVHDKISKSIMITDIAEKLCIDPIQVQDFYNASIADKSGILVTINGEATVLGQAIRDKDFVTELCTRFKEDDWYLIKHKYLFNILKKAEFTDIESLYTIAKNLNIDNIITRTWLQSLYDDSGNVTFCLKDMEDKLIRRRSIELLNKTKSNISDMSLDVSVMLEKHTVDIFNITHKSTNNKVFDAHTQVSDAMNIIQERMKNPGEIIGYSLGSNFRKTTLAMLGVQTKTLTIVAANQSVGKTLMCENWALHQAVDLGIGVLWFTLEMDKDRMTFRNLSILSNVPCTGLMTGNITQEQKHEIDMSAIKLDGSTLFLSERGHDLNEALAIARKYVIKDKVKIIYVDYIQLQYISDKRTDARHRELGMISKAWKQFSQDMDVAVIALSQLNKEALSTKTAEASQGAGSYEIAQDADVYVTLKDKSEEEISQRGIDHGNITLNLSKNRMGEREILIDIYADKPVYRMSEV